MRAESLHNRDLIFSHIKIASHITISAAVPLIVQFISNSLVMNFVVMN